MQQMRKFTLPTNIPSHDMERHLALAWAKLLHLDVNTITIADHFFKAGRDSVRAMELVSMVRSMGLEITVADIIKYPRLDEMSRRLKYRDAVESSIVEPFSLLERAAGDGMMAEAIAKDGIVREDIEDIYPCSPLPEGLIALSLKKSGAYVSHDVYEIADSVDISRFQKAWEGTVKAHPILCTRIMQAGDKGPFQVVVKNHTRWRYFSSHVELIEKSHERPEIGLGGELSRHAIIDQRKSTQQRFFVWSIHHAIHDGWSRPLLLQALERAYDTLSDLRNFSLNTFSPPPAYNRFIKFISEVDAAASKMFWTDYLTDMTAPTFPSLPNSLYEPVPSKTLSSESRFLQFAAYSFDVSLGDIFTTLIFGGFVCIPSEQQRIADLAGAINTMNVNQACLTSSVARTIQPCDCPGLKALSLGGEGLSNDVVSAWADYTHLLNTYGPAECTIWCACTVQLSTGSDRTNIGRGVGARLWIVENDDTLSPIGCVGEIVVEGPVVAKGYLNDKEKTKGSLHGLCPLAK